MIRPKDLEDFLSSPVTKELVSLIQEHRDASRELITDTMVNVQSVGDVDLYLISQYQGQVRAFDVLLDIENFLSERVEVKNE